MFINSNTLFFFSKEVIYLIFVDKFVYNYLPLINFLSTLYLLQHHFELLKLPGKLNENLNYLFLFYF